MSSKFGRELLPIASLADLCLEVLHQRLDDLPVLQIEDQEILYRILCKCSEKQLEETEQRHIDEEKELPAELIDRLWQNLFVQKYNQTDLEEAARFIGDEDISTWKEMYKKRKQFEEEKFANLQARLKKKEETYKQKAKERTTKTVAMVTPQGKIIQPTKTATQATVGKSQLTSMFDTVKAPPQSRPWGSWGSGSGSSSGSGSGGFPRSSNGTSGGGFRKSSSSSSSSSNNIPKPKSKILQKAQAQVAEKYKKSSASAFELKKDLKPVSEAEQMMRSRVVEEEEVAYRPEPKVIIKPVVVAHQAARKIDLTKRRPRSPDPSEETEESPIHMKQIFGDDPDTRLSKLKVRHEREHAKKRDYTQHQEKIKTSRSYDDGYDLTAMPSPPKRTQSAAQISRSSEPIPKKQRTETTPPRPAAFKPMSSSVSTDQPASLGSLGSLRIPKKSKTN